jgi:hypothetical protein
MIVIKNGKSKEITDAQLQAHLNAGWTQQDVQIADDPTRENMDKDHAKKLLHAAKLAARKGVSEISVEEADQLTQAKRLVFGNGVVLDDSFDDEQEYQATFQSIQRRAANNPQGFSLPAHCKMEDGRDVFVYKSLELEKWADAGLEENISLVTFRVNQIPDGPKLAQFVSAE